MEFGPTAVDVAGIACSHRYLTAARSPIRGDERPVHAKLDWGLSRIADMYRGAECY